MSEGRVVEEEQHWLPGSLEGEVVCWRQFCDGKLSGGWVECRLCEFGKLLFVPEACLVEGKQHGCVEQSVV